MESSWSVSSSSNSCTIKVRTGPGLLGEKKGIGFDAFLGT